MERYSMVFYKSFFEAIQSIEDPEERAAGYDAIIAYGIYGEEPKIDGIANALFILAKPLIDKDREYKER